MTANTKGEEGLIKAFNGLDPKLKAKIVEIDGPLKCAFAALHLARCLTPTAYLSAREISVVLEVVDISIEPKSVTNALKKAAKRVNRIEEGGETKYKIMASGIREIEPHIRVGEIGFTFVEAGNKRFGYTDIAGILSPLGGLIKVCDPYFGAESIDKLETFTHRCDIRFLTDKIKGDIPSLKRRITSGLPPMLSIIVKRVSNPNSLHDRYIISNDRIIFVGHGLKDLGNKDSFIIALPRDFSPGSYAATETAFDDKWARGVEI